MLTYYIEDISNNFKLQTDSVWKRFLCRITNSTY